MTPDQSDDHGHDHDHDPGEGSALSEMALRVRALESLLTEKGYVDPAARAAPHGEPIVLGRELGG